MKKRILPFILAALAVLGSARLFAQQTPFLRLNSKVLDVAPPTSRVRGTPGQMTVQRNACRTLATAETRRRIIDVAVQEWAFFGFTMVEPDADEDDFVFEPFPWEQDFDAVRRTEEAARVAPSIAGYWAVTPEGAGIVSNQNRAWNGPDGIGSRWVAPWSAAFVSWVMCESGLGDATQFQRAIAHHVYIDQAIRARDGRAPQAAFAAYDAGERDIEPGDLLCTSRRPVYRNLAERRGQMGEGARTHCDVVVKVDEPGNRVFAIGGNVRRSVSMKALPAARQPGKPLRVLEQPMLGRVRPVFAHLKLRAKPVEANALDSSPTIKAVACAEAPRIASLRLPAASLYRC
jgi:hypothetical protein